MVFRAGFYEWNASEQQTDSELKTTSLLYIRN